LDKDRKRRDWLEAQTLVEESEHWTDPEREVFQLDDDELDQGGLDGSMQTEPDSNPPLALPPGDTSQRRFLDAPTNLWEDDPTPHAPLRTERPSGSWHPRPTGPHRPVTAPPILEDISREHLDLLDESDIIDDQPQQAAPADVYPEVYSGEYQEAGAGNLGDDFIDDFIDDFGEDFSGDFDDEIDEFSEATAIRDPERQLEAPSNINVRTVHEISPDPGLLVMTQPGSMAAEQYRVLSLKLRESNDRRIISVLVPSSEVNGAVVAANLALALAEGSRSNVLLLDANLRGSEVSDLFGLEMGMPLGEQIRHHKRNPEDPWEVLGLGPSFHVVAAKPVQTNPSALLSSEIMADLVDELRQRFDFVILSAPPVMEAADGVILQDYVDGSILVAMAGISRTDSLRASLSRLGEGKVIGTVLLGVKDVGGR